MKQFRIMCKIDKDYKEIRREFYIEIRKRFWWSDIYTSNGYEQHTISFKTYIDAENYIIEVLGINHATHQNGNIYTFGY